ncbi:unnamed protein product [Dracunculus medinensis]|uniref:SCP domain-containing protein n=1 Tax=Dracunculus medinensis TaxID=318479 RepID=A0A0N4URP6_DRAME|nr:unnamed protein product [Dracunculus medinensis]
MGVPYVTVAIAYLIYMGKTSYVFYGRIIVCPLPVPNCNVENAQERGLLFGYERKRQLSMSVDINEDDLMKWNCELEKRAAQYIKKCRIAKIPRTNGTLVGSVYSHFFNESIVDKLFHPALYTTAYHENVGLSDEEWKYVAEVGCSQIFCRMTHGDNKGMLVKFAACFYKLRSPLTVGMANQKSAIPPTATTAPTIAALPELTIVPFTLPFTECLDSVISTNTKDKIINRYNWFRKLIKYAISEAGGIISDQTDDIGFKWNCFLELSATQSARQCNFTHSKEPSPLGESRKILLRSDRQKIFWETRKLSPNESLILEAVESWWSSGSWSHFSYFEHLSPHELSENYDFFTQLVNMETTYIGCGIGYCPAHHMGLNMHAIVCQYFPGIERNSSKFMEIWRVLRTYEEQIRDVIQEHS